LHNAQQQKSSDSLHLRFSEAIISRCANVVNP
jgi:hypothetical protein